MPAFNRRILALAVLVVVALSTGTDAARQLIIVSPPPVMPAPPPPSDASFYVDGILGTDCTSGNYSITNRNCTGSDGNAYNNVNDVLALEAAGDTTYFRTGTHTDPNSDVALAASGTSDNPITWRNYPGEAPILQFFLRVNNQDYRSFVGERTNNRLVFDGNGATIDWGIYSNAGAVIGLTLTNVEVRYFVNSGVYINLGTDVSISGSYIHHIGRQMGAVLEGDCLHFTGVGSSGTVTTSEIAYCEQDAVTLNGQTISDSLIHHAIRPMGSAAHADCIEGNGIVLRNIIYGCTNAGMIQATALGATTVIANNVFYGDPTILSPDDGTMAGNWMIQFTAAPAGALIVHNTFYNSRLGGIRIVNSGGTVEDVVIKNNIFHTMYDESSSAVPIEICAACDTGYESNYNIFFDLSDAATANAVASYDGAYRTLAQMCSLFTQECNSNPPTQGATVDPLLVSPGLLNLRLSAESPAINTGLAGLGFATDVTNTARDETPDIGAYERVP